MISSSVLQSVLTIKKRLANIDKVDDIKIRNFYSSKATIEEWKGKV